VSYALGCFNHQKFDDIKISGANNAIEHALLIAEEVKRGLKFEVHQQMSINSV
jgi:hypothetical protein